MKRTTRWLLKPTFIIISSIISISHAAPAPFNAAELLQVKQYLLNNIATADHTFAKNDQGRVMHSLPGAVLASPSNNEAGFNQDYQFHWIRDAAITMYEVVKLYENASGEEKIKLKPYLMNYISLERVTQGQMSHDGEKTLGQPKFNIDGTVWEGPWGRPQNDGPALRAITMTAIAEIFISEGNEVWVRSNLLNLIATDLRYILSEWQTSNYDLWEEVNDADHFFTKMVQRKSLIVGANLLKKLGDEHAASTYLAVANQIATSLHQHWADGRGYFTETVNQQYFKGGGLDSSILLGALYGNVHNQHDPFALDNDRIMSTVFYLRGAFANLYRLNIEHPDDVPLLGRYPSDVYDGKESFYGNPWILITNALGEYYYSLANIYRERKQIQVTKHNLLFFKQMNPQLVNKEGLITEKQQPSQFYAIIHALKAEGDKSLLAAKKYGVCYSDQTCLHFAEQVDRTSGHPASAKDLTWGYSTLLSAMGERE